MERFEKLSQTIKEFVDDRDWNKFHTPVNLAKSISIESGELLECFQWDNENYNLEDVKDELADIVNYCIQLSQVLGVDLIDITNKKIEKNAKKYPVEKAKGTALKYDKLK